MAKLQAAMGSLVAVGFLVVMMLGTPVMGEHELSKTSFKTTNLTWYQYETYGSDLNDTIVQLTNSTLGRMSVFEEYLTETKERNSTQYGVAVGTSTYHFQSATYRILITATVKMTTPYNGTFNIQGIIDVYASNSSLSIYGGTGDFLSLVKGYVVTHTIELGTGYDINKWTAFFLWGPKKKTTEGDEFGRLYSVA